MLGRVNTFLKPRFVRYAAEFTGKARVRASPTALVGGMQRKKGGANYEKLAHAPPES